jgi:hypothetical protein
VLDELVDLFDGTVTKQNLRRRDAVMVGKDVGITAEGTVFGKETTVYIGAMGLRPERIVMYAAADTYAQKHAEQVGQPHIHDGLHLGPFPLHPATLENPDTITAIQPTGVQGLRIKTGDSVAGSAYVHAEGDDIRSTLGIIAAHYQSAFPLTKRKGQAVVADILQVGDYAQADQVFAEAATYKTPLAAAKIVRNCLLDLQRTRP